MRIATTAAFRAVTLAAGTLLALAPPAGADTQSALEAFARGEHAQAAAEIERAATAGDPLAQFLLGAMHGGGQGVELDHAAAARWYARAAEAGHANAQFNLGALYAGGLGVERDFAIAREWFIRAALQGLAAAQFNLGHIYEQGLGTRADRARAFAWWHLAAMGGDDRSRERLEALARRMSPAELERAGGLYGELLAKTGGRTARARSTASAAAGGAR